MISAIVYTSNSGYTAQYARLLGRATGLPVNDLSQMGNPQPDQEVIYLGWVMAGRVMGLRKALRFFRVRAVCRVGMAPPSANDCDALRKKYALPEDTAVFALQGGFDMERLHGPYQWIMAAKCKEIRKKLDGMMPLNEEQQMTYEMVTGGASAVSADKLQDVLDWYRTQE